MRTNCATSWSKPDTRRKLLADLAEKGYGKEQLADLARLVDAEKSDLVRCAGLYRVCPAAISRAQRVDSAKPSSCRTTVIKPRKFVKFVLDQYIKQGVGELDDEKLFDLLRLKYDSVHDAIAELEISADEIRDVFVGFQQYLYTPRLYPDHELSGRSN